MDEKRLELTVDSHNKIAPEINRISNIIKKSKIRLQPNVRIYKSKTFKKTKKGIATIVFLNESYIPSALTLAKSYRLTNENDKQFNLICLVQDKKIFNGITYPGVSKKTINDLLEVFDIVYGIDLLKSPDNYEPINYLKSYQHYKNINFYITKCQIFSLVDYEQIFLLMLVH